MTIQQCYDAYGQSRRVVITRNGRVIAGVVKGMDSDIPHFPVRFMPDNGVETRCAAEEVELEGEPA